MAKHSKYKNTGILFELLVRQVTNDTLQGMDQSPAITILREFFKKNTSLKRELGLYQTIQNEKFKTESRANTFLDAVIREHGKLSKGTVKKQKYNLIKEIKKSYNLESFFSQRVNNYTANASIYCLFEGTTPIKTVKYREALVEGIVEQKKKKSGDTLSMYQKQDKDVRLLSQKILIEKFNNKWGKNLSVKQKGLLKEYIHNISNTTKLKDYLVNEITKSTKILDGLAKKVKDSVVKIKLQEVSSQMRAMKIDNNIKDKYVISLMRTYDLIQEVKNVIK